MMKNLYRLLVVLTAVIIAASLAKGIGLTFVATTFPEGEVAEIAEITEKDWIGLDDGTGVYYMIPDDFSTSQIFEITSSWDSLDIYLEDELLYSFSDEYHELGRAFHWIEIPEGSNGKRIILTSGSDMSSLENVIWNGCRLGTADAIRHHFFMNNLPIMLLAVMDALMAGILILILAVLRRKLSSEIIHGIWDLLMFIILNGVWLISDSGFLECFTTNTGLWALISYVVFMIMPVFLISFSVQLLTYRKEFLRILVMVSLCLTLATLILYLTRIAPLSTLLIFHQAMMVLDVAVIFVLCNYEIRHYRVRKMVPIRIGIVILGVFTFITFLLYWQNMNSLYPLFYGAGFTSFIACLTVSVVKQVYYSLGKKAEMDTYRMLAYKDVMTMVYNRSAFTKYQESNGTDVRESAYIMFDINGLKHVNDTMGHQAGDDLIIRAAECIRETFEEAGECYRIGGDEFMVVLENIHDKKDVQSIMEHFEKHVRNSNRHLNEEQAPLSIAYGYSLAGSLARSGSEMYEEADKQMYNRKRKMKTAM